MFDSSSNKYEPVKMKREDGLRVGRLFLSLICSDSGLI